MSPADARSHPVDSLAVDEVLQPLGFPVDSQLQRNTKISLLRLWTPPVVRTWWRSDLDSPKAGERSAIDEFLQPPRVSGTEKSLISFQRDDGRPTWRVRLDLPVDRGLD